jgi:hypothetical protein
MLQLRATRVGDLMQLLAVLGVGDAVGLVAVGLAGLGQKDQRRGIGGLSREGEVEQNGWRLA